MINHIEDDQYDIRIGDFGLAYFVSDNELLYAKCGSAGYIAPEIFKGIGYGFKADIFSLGCVFYNLLTGLYLFSGKDTNHILRSNWKCDLSNIKSFLKDISPQGRDLLLKILSPNPDYRPTAKDALKHEWFSCDRAILSNLMLVNTNLCTTPKCKRPPTNCEKSEICMDFSSFLLNDYSSNISKSPYRL